VCVCVCECVCVCVRAWGAGTPLINHNAQSATEAISGLSPHTILNLRLKLNNYIQIIVRYKINSIVISFINALANHKGQPWMGTALWEKPHQPHIK